jgi:hypothetical protein
MPPEYRAIEQATTVTRAQLAALIGVRLEGLVKRAPQRNTAVITDTRGNWAAPWIIPVARAGFMEVYSNHTFQPSATVRRGDLAFAVRPVSWPYAVLCRRVCRRGWHHAAARERSFSGRPTRSRS